jgi:hypothetical protein
MSMGSGLNHSGRRFLELNVLAYTWVCMRIQTRGELKFLLEEFGTGLSENPGWK